METGLGTLDYVLWLAGFLGHIVLLATLILRGSAKTFRVFTARVVYLILKTIALYAIHRAGAPALYARAYWTFAVGDYLLQIGVIVELATVVTRSAGVWFKPGLRQVFLYAGGGILAAALLARAISPPEGTGLIFWATRADIFMSMVTCEVFLAMAMVLNRQRRPWSREAIAIGQGLTLWALVVLAGQVIQLAMGSPGYLASVEYVREFLYLGTLVYWTVTLARPTVEVPLTREEIAERATELRERLLYGKRV